MNNNKFKKIIFLMLLVSFLLSITTVSSGLINNLKTNLYLEEVIRPTSDLMENETSKAIIYKSEKSERFSNAIITQPSTIENVIDYEKNIKYIRHTASITKSFKSFEWTFDNIVKKWKLLIDDSPYSVRFAKNGFYEINGDIYYFDENEYMVSGIVIDDMNIKYVFDEDGKMVSKELME